MALNTLVGLAMLDDQVREMLLDAESRCEVITSVPLSVGAAQYLDSLESAPDLHTFAEWILNGTELPSHMTAL